MDSFKRFGEEKVPDGECFYSSVKDAITGDNIEKLNGHINNEDCLCDHLIFRYYQELLE